MKIKRIIQAVIVAAVVLAGCPLIIESELPIEILSSGLVAYQVGQTPEGYGSWNDVSIAVSPAGIVGLLYHNDDLGLTYAEKQGVDWDFKKFNVDYQVFGGQNCLAMNLVGKAYISSSASDGCDEDLLYLTNKSGEWREYEPDAPGGESTGLASSVTVANDGSVYIAYFYWNDSDLRYATNESGDWELYLLDDGDVAWGTSQIGIDHHGKVHVVYAAGNGLWHAKQIYGAIWNKEEIPKDASDYYYYSRTSAIAFDGDDNLYVVSPGGLYIKYPDRWEYQSIFTEMFGNADDYTIGIDQHDIAIDAFGNVHICFSYQQELPYDPDSTCAETTHFGIYYATNSSGAWKAKPIAQWPMSVCDYGATSQRMAMDIFGNVHLVFIKPMDWKVCYTTFNPRVFLMN